MTLMSPRDSDRLKIADLEREIREYWVLFRAVERQRDRLRGALTFYAAEDNWPGVNGQGPGRSAIDDDWGQRAREALKEE